MSSSTAFRIVPVDAQRVRFEVMAPAEAIHPGAFGGGAQVVLYWTKDDALNCMATMLLLLRRPEFTRQGGFRGGEVPPCVVPVALGYESAPPGAMCRVIVESSSAESHFGKGVLAVTLDQARAVTLAERLMRRCGIRRVWLVPGNQVAWTDALMNDPDEESNDQS